MVRLCLTVFDEEEERGFWGEVYIEFEFEIEITCFKIDFKGYICKEKFL